MSLIQMWVFLNYVVNLNFKKKLQIRYNNITIKNKIGH